METLGERVRENYLDKLRPRERKPGEPRNDREAALLPFKKKLNLDRKAAGYPAYSDSYIAKMFKGYPEGRLELLFKECEAAQKFGGLLKFKLDAFHKGV